MQIIYGKSVYGGTAIGRICVYKKEKRKAAHWKITDIDMEIRRFSKAREKALEQLQELYEKAEKAAGQSSAAIFEAHQMILKDEYYICLLYTSLKRKKWAISKLLKNKQKI